MPTADETSHALAVPAERLRRASDALRPEIESSDLLPAGKPHLGQQRAVDALQFGIGMRHDGYNIFVLGPHGSHRHGLAAELAQESARERPAPDDWCYVNNFGDPERPRALRFAAGQGKQFRNDMHDLIGELRLAIPAAFEGDDYRNQLKVLEEATQKEVEQHWKSLDELAAKQDIGVLHTPTGYVLAPVSDGKVLGEEEFAKLPEEKRTSIQAAIQQLGEELKVRIEEMPKLRKQHRERVRALNREVTTHAVGVLLDDLQKKYEELDDVSTYLEEVRNNIIENAEGFLPQEKTPLPFVARDASQLFFQYEVNLLVKNEQADNAPVIYEANPSYQNIVGKVEHRSEMGALVTDFRMIRAGALHQANGGYLILDMHRLLARPFVWEGLKQSLTAKQMRIESPGETYGLVSTTSLQPEPIPLDLKIILIGERWLYFLLCRFDSEFGELFNVAADMDDELERTSDNVSEYASLIAERARNAGILPLSTEAVLRVIEERARRVEDGEKLSTHMRSLDDLLMQSDYWARKRNVELIGREDVVEAISAGRRRLGRMQSKVIDAIDRNTLLIDTSGSCIGQVNGLSVVDFGEFRYGHPVRITATTRIGTGDVVDIEREVELGGAIHSKGMMILASALSSRYATHIPLSMHGSVVFEQSYGGVEGDSASVAELCALLSSLSGIPIRQNLAVTGSINQLGRVQVVGGTNEKIEGFFDICRQRTLDGTHGVIIPAENVKHLMLREDVVEAVEQDLFRVFAVQNIDEAITILTGVDAGSRDEDGEFPGESLNFRIEQQLIRYAELRQEFAGRTEKNETE